MKVSKNANQEVNFLAYSLSSFVEYYNHNVPAIFPRASVKALEKFKETHPVLFGSKNEWTIDKHRKKLMDWLSSYRD